MRKLVAALCLIGGAASAQGSAADPQQARVLAKVAPALAQQMAVRCGIRDDDWFESADRAVSYFATEPENRADPAGPKALALLHIANQRIDALHEEADARFDQLGRAKACAGLARSRDIATLDGLVRRWDAVVQEMLKHVKPGNDDD